MSAVLAGLASALVAWGLGLIAWSLAPRRVDGWTVCDFGPPAKALSISLLAAAAFAGGAGAFAEGWARIAAWCAAGAAAFVGLHLFWHAFFYRCRWDIDGVRAYGPPFPSRVIAWDDIARAGWSPIAQRFWIADAEGRKVWWSPMMRGWQPLWRAVERRLTPADAAAPERNPTAPTSHAQRPG